MADPIEAARNGDLEAMKVLYEEHRDLVYAVGLSVCGNRPDADEVVQESFLRAFRSMVEWRGEGKFSTWLYAIALRTALNWKRRFHRAPRPAAAPQGPEAPDEAIDRAEAAEELRRAIRELPLQQRLVLTLRHLDGRSMAEIAEIQGCAVGTVKSNLHHAMAKLKEALDGDAERARA
jgi:RNA polymerase sigma-70 factor (ECF subfamily)